MPAKAKKQPQSKKTTSRQDDLAELQKMNDAKKQAMKEDGETCMFC